MTRTRSETAPDPVVALRYGLAVFPMPSGHKHPEPGWRARIITSPVGLDQWPHGANVGIACRASNVVGLDLDGPAGVTAFTACCIRAGQPWPDTLTVTTPHDGVHLYFRVPTGCVILSSSTDRHKLGTGIDVRAPGRRTGGYLTGPDSHVDDKPYTIQRDTAITELPTWLVTKLREL